MNQQEAIEALEPEWDRREGFFAKIRIGRFDPAQSKGIVDVIGRLELGDSEEISRRLVSLLWYLPTFCGWQVERVGEAGGDVKAYKRFVTELTNELEEKLGIPSHK